MSHEGVCCALSSGCHSNPHLFFLLLLPPATSPITLIHAFIFWFLVENWGWVFVSAAVGNANKHVANQFCQFAAYH